MFVNSSTASAEANVAHAHRSHTMGNGVPLESIMNLVRVGAGVALIQALGEPSMYRNKTCNKGCVDLAKLAFEANRTMSSAPKSIPCSLAKEAMVPMGTK